MALTKHCPSSPLPHSDGGRGLGEGVIWINLPVKSYRTLQKDPSSQSSPTGWGEEAGAGRSSIILNRRSVLRKGIFCSIIESPHRPGSRGWPGCPVEVEREDGVGVCAC